MTPCVNFSVHAWRSELGYPAPTQNQDDLQFQSWGRQGSGIPRTNWLARLVKSVSPASAREPVLIPKIESNQRHPVSTIGLYAHIHRCVHTHPYTCEHVYTHTWLPHIHTQKQSRNKTESSQINPTNQFISHFVLDTKAATQQTGCKPHILGTP